MAYSYDYEVHFPEFCDEGPEEISVTPDEPIAVAVFLHPSALHVSDRERIELLYKTFTRAAVTAKRHLLKDFPNALSLNFSDALEPLEPYIYDSVGDEDLGFIEP